MRYRLVLCNLNSRIGVLAFFHYAKALQKISPLTVSFKRNIASFIAMNPFVLFFDFFIPLRKKSQMDWKTGKFSILNFLLRCIIQKSAFIFHNIQMRLLKRRTFD